MVIYILRSIGPEVFFVHLNSSFNFGFAIGNKVLGRSEHPKLSRLLVDHVEVQGLTKQLLVDVALTVIVVSFG